ncbi:hypothetical protein LK231_0250 [Lactococcus lactis subsp. lactis]|nr:hypothetical protein LK231_0250 [Lactococcus lactis subsp. lactis]
MFQFSNFQDCKYFEKAPKRKILVKFIVSKFASQNFFVSLFYRISCQI